MYPDEAAPRGSASREARKRRERDVLKSEGRLARDTGDPRWGTGGMPVEARPTSRARRAPRGRSQGGGGAATPPLPLPPQPQPHGAASFAGLAPRGYRRRDDRVRDEVCDRFTENACLDPREIDVGVREGRVMLSGAIASGAQRRLAEDLAWSVPGVVDVDNRLAVPPPPARRTAEAAAISSAKR